MKSTLFMVLASVGSISTIEMINQIPIEGVNELLKLLIQLGIGVVQIIAIIKGWRKAKAK